MRDALLNVVGKEICQASVDLLRKSRAEGKLKVVDTSDEVEAKSETSAPATVALAEDSENLELGVDMLDAQTQLAQGMVVMLLKRL